MNLSGPLRSLSLVLAGAAAASLLAGPAPSGPHDGRCLTHEERAILRHLRLVQLDDGQGGLAPTIRITEANLQIVNGLGATNGFREDPTSLDPERTRTNSVGNLIVGYNEPGSVFGDDRTGSHNVVAGSRNTYASFGGLVLGAENRIRAPYASVAGGAFNAADGPFSIVAGGDSNEAWDYYGAVTGGEHNTAAGFAASVVGGFGNLAAGSFATVSGGARNVAGASSSSITGGTTNLTAGDVSSVNGGELNTADGLYSAVSGGSARTVAGDHDWRAGELFQDD